MTYAINKRVLNSGVRKLERYGFVNGFENYVPFSGRVYTIDELKEEVVKRTKTGKKIYEMMERFYNNKLERISGLVRQVFEEFRRLFF